jgi:protein-tyrosine phosphatase
VELIKGLMQIGIKQSIATPHIIGDMYRNTTETIHTALHTLQQKIKALNLEFKISAAAEYMLDDYFLDLLEKKQKLLTLKDNIILTEFSYAERPQKIEHFLFQIITEGYQPLLAHPERYSYFHNDLKIYHRLSDMGFLLQINLLSLTGYYGKNVAKVATYLLNKKLVSFAGTDLHHARHLQALQNSTNKLIFAKAFEKQIMNEAFLF